MLFVLVGVVVVGVVFAGGAGFDDTHGNIGDDTVHGGDGCDRLAGGEGDDELWGDGDWDPGRGGSGENVCMVEDAKGNSYQYGDLLYCAD